LCELTDTAIEFTQTEAVSSIPTHTAAAPARPRGRGGWLGRLPEVGRSLGKSVVDFKKGLKGREDADEDEDTDFELSEAGPDDLGPPQWGEERSPNLGRRGMWYYTVEEGQRALMVRKDGRMEVIVGPRRGLSGAQRLPPR